MEAETKIIKKKKIFSDFQEGGLTELDNWLHFVGVVMRKEADLQFSGKVTYKVGRQYTEKLS